MNIRIERAKPVPCLVISCPPKKKEEEEEGQSPKTSKAREREFHAGC